MEGKPVGRDVDGRDVDELGVDGDALENLVKERMTTL